MADRDALDADPKWDSDASAECDQLDGRGDGLIVGRVEGVVGVVQPFPNVDNVSVSSKAPGEWLVAVSSIPLNSLADDQFELLVP